MRRAGPLSLTQPAGAGLRSPGEGFFCHSEPPHRAPTDRRDGEAPTPGSVDG